MSKNDGNVRKHNAFAECQNVSKNSRVSKRVKTCQKSVKKVSKKCQKHVKTCQNVSKNCRGAVFRVKTCQKNSFLTLFDTFFDTQFCLLGHLIPNDPCRAKLMIIFEAMLVPGRFSSGVQSCKAPDWAAGFAGRKLSEESEDNEHGNSERPGAELNTSHTKRPLAGQS